MANPTLTTTPAPPVGDPMIDALTSGYKWNLGEDRMIDWSISGGLRGEQFTDVAAMRATMGQALGVIGAFINVKFNFVGTFDSPALAASAGSEINLFLDANNVVFEKGEDDKALAGAFPPSAEAGAAAGDVVINMNSAAKDFTSFKPGSVGFETLLHEIMHALGLKHPFEEMGGHSTVKAANEDDRDNTLWTVMSYGDSHYSESTGTDHELHDATPMALDVLALQSLYGPNTTLNAGNTLIPLDTTRFFQTIWDPAGYDFIDASNEVQGWFIELPWDYLSTSVHLPAGAAMTMADFVQDVPTNFYWLVGFIEGAYGSNYDDEIYGNAGENILLGGAGNDTIVGDSGDDYLRGEDGDDSIWGGTGFDDINGNKGKDVLRGAAGNDWVVGGQDDDKLNGDSGDDIVYGNLGADRVFGGAGDDWVRGGQGDDTLNGGDGNDFLSGDRGNDTIIGGAGADRFNLIAGAGMDRVTDFRSEEGDRVSIEGGISYTLSFANGGALIELAGGDQMLLVGITSTAQLGTWLWSG